MYLIITEKDTAAKRIAAILSENKVKKVRYPKLGVETYEFTYNDDHTIVMGLSGHVVGIDFPNEYNNWQKNSARDLIDAEIVPITTNKKIVTALKVLGKKADIVTIATDYDREGELIGVEALTLVQSVNPDVKFNRALYSAITPKDITHAFDNLTTVNFDLADAGHAREVIDLVWGAALTRYISLCAGRLGKLFLSVGRVQSPTLALIVEREKEREAFIPVQYWEIEATLETKSKESFIAEYHTNRIFEKEIAERVYSNVIVGGDAKIKSIEAKQRKEKPPIPFNTTEFYVAANAVGISVNNAKRMYQTLYEAGFLSYPRTDSTIYPESLELRSLIEMFVGTEFDEYAKALLKIADKDGLKPTQGKKEDPAHPPIHPVAPAKRSDMKEDEWKIYELVVRRFFATFAGEAEWDTLRVEIDINTEDFKTNGSRLTNEGWRWYYPYNKPEDRVLPHLEEGDVLKITHKELFDKETQPPSRYGQGRLIRVMDDMGIGTKATRADIINKLVSRYYIHGNPLQPTNMAYSVIDTLEQYAPTIVKPDMTKQLEADMDKISEGQISESDVLKESREMLNSVFDDLEKNHEDIGRSLQSGLREDRIVGKCQRCGSDLSIRKSKKGARFIGCNGYPECDFSLPVPRTGQVVVTDKMCDEHQMYKIKIITEGKRPWELGCPQCNFIEWQKKLEEDEKNGIVAETSAERAKRIKKEKAAARAEREAKAANPTELSDIKGLGTASLQKLNDSGIMTLADLAGADAAQLARETGISSKNIEKWKEVL
ncbi:DNA topoisomerase I [Methanimicrococcus blatticola]|uniref:DNA topoisomerase 1 n=1 Tax=Methanimicrococcus blatticola TaxID=91560 RepID=A0A484F6E2_9EURY|nr:DNA topoisomerase I [Methanimicrococcus blatticola]MBZ3934856.1 DNA topoisomerase I [Methanimicrococcus blatticola]MCC2509046.1 DNA topoisomerase I [Methanimicrococcus blatticola]TDQ70928.1 DNA topoisomerase I [Methanimicrococcus blatticola]